MSMLIAALVFVPLLAIAFAHLLWALGRTWPIRSPELLARAVIGTSEAHRVPRGRALLVAIICLATGVLALALADDTAGGWQLDMLALPAAVLFLARGLVSYTSGWRQAHPEPIFAANDRRVYAPTCLFIGLGLLVLVLLRLF